MCSLSLRVCFFVLYSLVCCIFLIPHILVAKKCDPRSWRSHTHLGDIYNKQRYMGQMWNTRNPQCWPVWWVPSLYLSFFSKRKATRISASWILVSLYWTTRNGGVKKTWIPPFRITILLSYLNPSLWTLIPLSNFHCLCFFLEAPLCPPTTNWIDLLHSQSELQKIASDQLRELISLLLRRETSRLLGILLMYG